MSHDRYEILQSDKEIAGVVSREGEVNLLKSIFIRRSIGEANLTSERTTILASTITLKQEEFFNLGVLNIAFEVEK